jgi:hypothetical protein
VARGETDRKQISSGPNLFAPEVDATVIAHDGRVRHTTRDDESVTGAAMDRLIAERHCHLSLEYDDKLVLRMVMWCIGVTSGLVDDTWIPTVINEGLAERSPIPWITPCWLIKLVHSATGSFRSGRNPANRLRLHSAVFGQLGKRKRGAGLIDRNIPAVDHSGRRGAKDVRGAGLRVE